MRDLFNFLDTPAPIDAPRATLFAKVITVFLNRRMRQMSEYMKEHGTVRAIIRHIGEPSRPGRSVRVLFSRLRAHYRHPCHHGPLL
jgi:hypothetical protein